MSLKAATVDQLLQWQADLMAEIALRMRGAPAQALPPWMQPQLSQPTFRVEDAPAQTPPPGYVYQPRFQTAPPAMLGGQQPLKPGTVIATERTDPKLAALFAAQPARADGMPPINGNGRGEGIVELGTAGR